MVEAGVRALSGAGDTGSKLVRLSTFDSLVNMRIGMWLGPIAMPPVEDLRRALVKAASLGPKWRLGLVWADETSWAVLGPRIAARADEVIRELPASVENPREWLEQNRIPDLPVQFAVAGNHLGVIADHRLLDGFLGLRLPSLLIELAAGEPAPALGELVDRPLSTALWHTFGAKPATWRTLYTHMRNHRRPAGPAPRPPETQVEPAVLGPMDSPREVRHLQTVMERGPLAELRRWGRGRLGFSASLLLVAAAGLRDVGIEIAPRGVLVVDLRRYLPDGVTTLSNFISGVQVPLLGPGATPEALEVWIEEALEVGRPLAAMSTTVAKAALRAKRPHGQAAPAGPRAESPAQVSISNDGLLRVIDKLPWLVGPEERKIQVVGDALEPDALGLITYMAAGRLHLSVSFQANRYDPDLVMRALTAMATEPVRLLDTYYSSDSGQPADG